MLKKVLTTILFFVITLAFTGCERSVITAQSLTPQFNKNSIHQASIELSVDGGKKVDILGIQEIGNEELFNAVKNTITTSKLFSTVLDKNADYRLEIFVVKVGQPVAGRDMTVNVEFAWTLKKINQIIWQKSITTSSTKTSKEIENAYNRVVAATEEAAKNNILKALEIISQLKL